MLCFFSLGRKSSSYFCTCWFIPSERMLKTSSSVPCWVMLFRAAQSMQGLTKIKFGLLICQGIDLLKSQRTDKVDITLRPEELEGLDDVALAAKYEIEIRVLFLFIYYFSNYLIMFF